MFTQTGPVLEKLISSSNFLDCITIQQSNLFQHEQSIRFSSHKHRTHCNTAFENQKLHPRTLCFIPSLLRHPDPTQLSQRIFKSKAPVQFSLLLKQICKQLRKDRNTASKKTKTVSIIPFTALYFYRLHSSAVQKTIQGQKKKPKQ